MRLSLVIFLVVFSSCGYKMKHRLEEAFYRPGGIFIPVFDNDTSETGAETVFTNAFIREMMGRHEVVVTKRKKASLEIRGVLTQIEIKPTAFSESKFPGLQPYKRLPAEYGVTVKISLALRDIKEDKTLWVRNFQGFRRIDTPVRGRTYDFQAPSSLGFRNQSIIESLYPQIARDIMHDVYDEMVSAF